jgi:hypothetical protein
MSNLNLKVGDRVKTPGGYTGTVAYKDDEYGGYAYAVDFDLNTPLVVSNGNCFNADGSQAYPGTGKATRIDPVETRPAIGTKLFCTEFPSTKGEVLAHTTDGNLIVQNGLGSLFHLNGDLKDQDGDVWQVAPAPVETRVYRNIYADGTVGETAHKDCVSAIHGTKYGKVRVGILAQRMVDGAVVGAYVSHTEPQLRTRDGITNPFA